MSNPYYSDMVRRFFENPEHAGSFNLDDGRVSTGEAGEFRLGRRVCFQMRIESDRIIDARFRAYGCPHTIATAAWLARRISGQTLAVVKSIDALAVAKELDLPEDKLACVLVVEDAINACVENFRRTDSEPVST